MNDRRIDDVLPFESVEAVADRRPVVDDEALAIARNAIDGLNASGPSALWRQVEAFDEWPREDSLRHRGLLDRDDLRRAVDRIDADLRRTLERTAARVRDFAVAQRSCLQPLRMPVPGTGLVVGHDLVPIEVAGCYAPGGRFPLPSSVLMTVIPARVAGVGTVRVASPRPTDATLAAAWFAEADQLLAAGGAHAIGALALGIEGAACDIIVGPGNRFVTAAKSIVSGVGWSDRGPVAIDALAGASELLVLADGNADPEVIAADLLAQAEHDPEAGVWFATLDPRLIDAVRDALAAACDRLPEPNRGIAARAIAQGAALVARSEDELVEIADRLAPEHLEILVADAGRLADRIAHAGAVFLEGAAEVFGDYGVGPNHVLPTGRTARHRAGLSVFDFLRVRTRIERGGEAAVDRDLVEDVATLARAEGLEAHARAAEVDRQPAVPVARRTISRCS